MPHPRRNGVSMNIITIGREFGSGGRELGKRLADALGVPCYDKEIIDEVAKFQGITPDHVEHITQTDIRRIYAGTIGRTMMSPVYYNSAAIEIMVAQQDVIKKLASQGDCVIVGRQADIILAGMKPLNLFVYADKESKLKRCLERAHEGETERSIGKQMKKIDRDRASNRRIMTESEWGKRESYHLCINTSGVEIKDIAPALAEYAKAWFKMR